MVNFLLPRHRLYKRPIIPSPAAILLPFCFSAIHPHMLRPRIMHSQIFLLFLLCASVLSQDVYGNGGQGGGLFGGALGLGGYTEGAGSPVHAAISTKRTFEIRPIIIESQPPVPSVVDVQPSEQPVQVIFRTQSSPVLVQQVHTPSTPAEIQKSSSEDEAHRVLHEVHRPVIQELREVITPFRRVWQEIRPVVERVHTIVAKGDKRGNTGFGIQSVQQGYQDHGRMISEEAHYGLAMNNEIGAPVIAAAPQMNHNLAMATQNTEMYLPDPRMVYRLAKMGKAKRARANASRRA